MNTLGVMTFFTLYFAEQQDPEPSSKEAPCLIETYRDEIFQTKQLWARHVTEQQTLELEAVLPPGSRTVGARNLCKRGQAGGPSISWRRALHLLRKHIGKKTILRLSHK